jgi:hypothetical protein
MIGQNQFAEGLRPFDEFSTMMIEKMGSEQRNDLLRDLYRLAGEKVEKEQCARRNRSAVLELRLKRRRMSKVRAHFSNAARNLEEAAKCCGVEIDAADADIGSLFDPSKELRIAVATEKKTGLGAQSSRINSDAKNTAPAYFLAAGGKIPLAALMAKDLRKAAEEATFREQIIAAKIPPSQRIGAEKRRADEYFSHSFGGVEPVAPPQPGPKATVVDRWFVGAAASYLDKYQISQGSQIRIIARLFEAAFRGRFRSEESVRKLLRRQKERGRPECQLTSPTVALITEIVTTYWLHGVDPIGMMNHNHHITRWEKVPAQNNLLNSLCTRTTVHKPSTK